MVRALPVLALLVMAAPSVAAAETCMCVAAQPAWDGAEPSSPLLTAARLSSTRFEPEQLGVFAEVVTPYESVEVGPFFSSDGSALSSTPEVARPRRSQPREVLWCASPDDPRCSGRDVPQPRGPHGADGSHAAAPGGVAPPRLETFPSDALGARPIAGGPRSAVKQRLERPPRT